MKHKKIIEKWENEYSQFYYDRALKVCFAQVAAENVMKICPQENLLK